MLSKLRYSHFAKWIVYSSLLTNLNLLATFQGEFNPIIPLTLSVVVNLALLNSKNGKISTTVSKKIIILGLINGLFLIHLFLNPSLNSVLYIVKYLSGPIIFITLLIIRVEITFNEVKRLILTVFLYFLLVEIGVLENFNHMAFTRGPDSPSAPLVKEPSYFFFYISLLAVILERSLISEKVNSVRETWTLRTCLFVMSLMTGSLLNYLFIILYLYYIIPRKLILPAATTLITLVFYTFYNLPTRVQNIALSLRDNLDFYDIMFIEPSGSTRLILNSLAFSQIIKSPIGNGLGSFPLIFSEFLSNNPIYFKHEVVGSMNITSPSTYFASFANDFGVFIFLLIILILPLRKIYYDNSFLLFLCANISILIFFQSPITNTTLWIFLYFLNEGVKSKS